MLMNIIIPDTFQSRSLGIISKLLRTAWYIKTHRNTTPRLASCRWGVSGKEKETEPLTKKHTLLWVQGHCKVNPHHRHPQQGYWRGACFDLVGHPSPSSSICLRLFSQALLCVGNSHKARLSPWSRSPLLPGSTMSCTHPILLKGQS